MKLNVVALAKTCGILWGGSILLLGVFGQFSDGYGQSFQRMIGDLYPFYEGTGEMGDAFVGALVGLVDGAIGGALLGLLYNYFGGRAGKTHSA